MMEKRHWRRLANRLSNYRQQLSRHFVPLAGCWKKLDCYDQRSEPFLCALCVRNVGKDVLLLRVSNPFVGGGSFKEDFDACRSQSRRGRFNDCRTCIIGTESNGGLPVQNTNIAVLFKGDGPACREFTRSGNNLYCTDGELLNRCPSEPAR